MDSQRTPGETPRVKTADSPLVESAPIHLSVYQGVVYDVVRRGVGQDLVPVHVHTHSVGGWRLFVEHSALDLYDETRNQEVDWTCHLRA